MSEGQHSAAMAAHVAEGAEPGSPAGPEWARGCDKCKFGIVHAPDLWTCGVPPFLARAMAIDLDGLCYIVYCDCKAGEIAQGRDANERERMKLMPTVITVIEERDEHGRKVLSWGTEEPSDYIPGLWWQLAKERCNK